MANAPKVKEVTIKKSSQGKFIHEVDLDFIGSKEETAESRTIASRKRLRQKMNSDVEMFLQQGGEIQEVDDNVMADPPKKPVSNYGSRPI